MLQKNSSNLSQKQTCIYVVGHKAFIMPTNDPIYKPLMVGSDYGELPGGWISDNTGNNISEKNRRYNELTGLYWIWKNSDADIVGLCHYRRFFTTIIGKIKNLILRRTTDFIDQKYIEQVLKKYDVILHNKTFTIRGNQNHLCVKTNGVDRTNGDKLSREILDMTNKLFERFYPEDKEIYQRVMKCKYAHLLNIIICQKELLDKYCEWLFPLLFEIEKEIEKKYPEQKMERCLGLLAERLLDVWISKEGLRVKECFTINIEKFDWKIW